MKIKEFQRAKHLRNKQINNCVCGVTIAICFIKHAWPTKGLFCTKVDLPRASCHDGANYFLMEPFKF